MRITDPTAMVEGMEIFPVNGFTNSSTHDCSIQRLEVIKVSITPYTGKGPPDWLEYKRLAFVSRNLDVTRLDLKNGVWEEDTNIFYVDRIDISSMQDMGIIAQNYNKHQVFTSLAEAMLYGEGKVELEDIAEAPAIGLVGDYDRAMKVI